MMTGCKHGYRALVLMVSLAVVAWGCGPGDAIDYRGSGILDSSGGVIEAGGVTLEAPPRAVYEVARFEVAPMELPAPLPEGLVLVGSPVDIDVDRDDQLDMPIIVAMGYDDTGIADEYDLLVLHFNDRHGWESVTVLSHDMEENVITFESRVFSPFVICAVGTNPPPAYNVGFEVKKNGWRIENFGDPFSPSGQCLGMAAYACWCFLDCHDYLHDKYDKETAHLTAMRAFQAQSQYWASRQFDYEQELGEARTGDMLRRYLYYTKDPQIFLMCGNIGCHATVAYAYEPDKFLFYDVNYVDVEQQVAFTNGNFGTYDSFNQFGFMGGPSIGRTESYGNLTAQAMGGFKQADHLEVTSPEQGGKVQGTQVTVEGSVSDLNKASVLVAFPNPGEFPGALASSDASVVSRGNGAFSYSWTGLEEGKNRVILHSATPVSAQSTSHRNADTFILEVEAAPGHEAECDDNIDNDGDGLTDCEDTEDCPCGDECGAELVRCGDVINGTTVGGSNLIDQHTSCSQWDDSGPERIYLLEETDMRTVHADIVEMQEGVDLDVFIHENGCAPETCKEMGSHEAWCAMDPGKKYYIIVDGYEGDEGTFTLEVNCE